MRRFASSSSRALDGVIGADAIRWHRSMKERDKQIVDKVLQLDGASKFALWQYYQDRADQIKERLWSTGTWLIAVGTAILAIPFTTDLLDITNDALPLQMVMPVPVLFVALFGSLVSVYSIAVVRDYSKHIQSNWRRADYIKSDELSKLRFSTTGSNTLILILGFQLAAHIALFVYSISTLGPP